MRKVALLIALVVSLATLAVLVAGQALTRSAARSVGEPPQELRARSISIPVGKSFVAGWLAQAPPGGGAILLLHSIRADRRQMLERAKFLKAAGYSVLLIDLQAHVTDRLAMRLGATGSYLAPLLLWQLPLLLGISEEQLSPIAEIPSLGAPLFVVSGAQDMHTTAAETKRIFKAANEPKDLWLVEGAAHVDLHAYAPKEYQARVLAFLDRHLRFKGNPAN